MRSTAESRSTGALPDMHHKTDKDGLQEIQENLAFTDEMAVPDDLHNKENMM
jgi:hypothetical protein